jgi:Kdo2-lipid IVA lauroyltransferase/acyltransferase
MISKIFTYTGIALLKLVSKWPMSILYLASDVMFPVVYYVFRYRRDVVTSNLINAFPEKTNRERSLITKRYFRHLCDLVVETLKTPSFSPDEISERMIVRNPEVLNAFFDHDKSVIVLAMHYGNWEWLLNMPLSLKHHHYFVYKPLENEIFDRFFNRVRERFGGETVSMSLILRKLLNAEKEKITVLTWLAADQAPPWNHPFWTYFLNQETMFFNGPAKLAQRFNHPVFFQQVRKLKRGYYETWFELLVENPLELTEESIIVKYVKKAETVIRNSPEYYLWSHRRWKYKKLSPTQ